MRRQVFDLHCDTALRMVEEKQGLKENRLHLDLARMEEYDGYIQVFAAFVDQKDICVSPMNHCIALLEKLHKEIQQNREHISLITTVEELEQVRQNRGIGAILSLEGGEALEGNLSAIWMYYQLGVRLITLTWNWANEISDGIMESRGGGLTQFGREAVSMMEQLGILIDVSHLSERGFWDVAECTKRPFVASHSCVKALCGHPRNLDDAQISCLIQRRGGIGINFYPEFLSGTGVCSVEEIVHHMEYILNMGGEDVLGLGSDFDGVSSLPKEMEGVQDMTTLIQAMENRGFCEALVEKILFGNFHRIFKESMEERP